MAALLEQITELRSRIKELDSHLFHLNRSQRELEEFLLESPGDEDFIQAIEENAVIIVKKGELVEELRAQLQLLDPTYERVMESLALQTGSQEGNRRPTHSSNDGEGGDEEDDEDNDDDEGEGVGSNGGSFDEYSSISDYIRRAGEPAVSTTSSAGASIDLQGVTRTMASMFEDRDGKPIAIEDRGADSGDILVSCDYNYNISSSSSSSSSSSNSNSNSEGMYL